MSASLLPAEYQLYSADQTRGVLGGFQAGIGTGPRVPAFGGMGPRERTECRGAHEPRSRRRTGCRPTTGRLLFLIPMGTAIANTPLANPKIWPQARPVERDFDRGRLLANHRAPFRETTSVTAAAPGFQSTVLNIPYDAANPHAYRVGLNVGATKQ